MSWNVATAVGLLVLAAIHLTPAVGLAGAAALQRLYGVAVVEPNLLLLMQHRALLFGLLGLLLVGAAFVPAWRLPALIGASLSLLGYLALVALASPVNAELQRVAWVDVVALLPLAVAWFGWSRSVPG